MKLKHNLFSIASTAYSSGSTSLNAISDSVR